MTATEQPPPPITKDTVLHLQEITEDNWRAVTKLRTSEGQAGNLASNAMSLLESHYAEDSWVRAIYAGETMVGFLMMALWDPNQKYYIWRFMIDQRYQGLGFGKQGVNMAIEHVRKNHPLGKVLGVMSTPREGKDDVKPEDSPYNFYMHLGFKQVAPPDEDGEIELALDL